MTKASRFIQVFPSRVGVYCNGCGDHSEEGEAVILTIGDEHAGVSAALCPGCRIKTEALLRGARKGMR